MSKISRRDWLRLRIPRENQTLGEDTPSQKSTSTRASGLQSIEHPPNHDGMDMNELPPMREAELSAQEVESLFGDIAALGSDILLMQRSTGPQRAPAANVNSHTQLEAAKTLLLSGKTKRIQIRYKWRDSLWIDTLNNAGDFYKLIRIEHS